MNDEGFMYSTRELAAMLGMSPQSLANWRSRGEGPCYVKVGTRTVRYRAEDVRKFLKEGGVE